MTELFIIYYDATLSHMFIITVSSGKSHLSTCPLYNGGVVKRTSQHAQLISQAALLVASYSRVDLKRRAFILRNAFADRGWRHYKNTPRYRSASSKRRTVHTETSQPLFRFVLLVSFLLSSWGLGLVVPSRMCGTRDVARKRG